MARSSIRLRVFLAIMAVISGLLVMTGWIMGTLVDRYMDTEIADTLQRGRRAYESFAAVREAALVQQARSLAQAPHLRAVMGTPDVDEQTVRVTLASLGETVGGSLLFLTDAGGRLVADNRGRDDFPDAHAFSEMRSALEGKERAGVWNYAGSDYVVALIPISIASTQVGVLGLGYPISAQVHEVADATGLDVAVLHGGLVVAASWARPGLPAFENRYDSLRWSEITPEANHRIQVDGREVMATSLSLADGKYQLVLTRSLDNVLTQFRQAKTELMLIGVMIAGVALLVSRSVANRIARPIRALTDAASSLARGDLTAHVAIAASDEIGTLGRTFNSMARQLQFAMQEVMQKARAAEQASDAKSTFLATMSHELRTPLNAIVGLNEQLRETPLSEEQQDYVRTVQRAGEELLALIDKLLEFAKMESGDFRLDHVEFDLHNCVQRAVDDMGEAFRAKKLAFDVSISPALPRTARGPLRQVGRVLSQYLSNAEKFTPAGSIHVRASLAWQSENDFILQVEVEDTGIGIAADRLDRLFKPFSQLESNAARTYAGTGVGLAIAKELVSLMKGEVGVRTRTGQGSTFWFTAKLEKCAQDLQHATAALPAPTAKTKDSATPLTPVDERVRQRRALQRVLIVEDNPVNQKVVAVAIGKAGWSFELAGDGQRAVEAAATIHFDLVLMDCQMPVMDGYEATRRIRSSTGMTPSDVAIIALTANAFDADREACLASGMDDFVAKPFRAQELVALIERWMSVRQRASAS